MIKQGGFTFIPHRGKSLLNTDLVFGLTAQKDFINFLLENEGISLIVTIEHENIRSEKKRLYRFLNGILIPCIVEAKIANGEVADKVSVLIEMKAEFGKDIHVNKKGESMAILMSQEDMSKSRLLQFVKDSIQYLEQEYGTECPDSQKWKEMKLSAE